MNTDRYTRFLEKRGKFMLAGTALLMVIAVVGIARLHINTDFDIFMPPSSPYKAAMDSMAAQFGDSDQIVVIAETPTDSDLELLPQIATDISDIPQVVSAQSPVPSSIVDMSASERADTIENLKKVTGGTAIVEHNGTQYAIVRVLLEPHGGLPEVINAIEAVFAAHDISITISGEPYLQAAVFRYIIRILLTIPPIVIILMLGVFRLRIGSMRATILSLVPAGVAAALTLGGISWIEGDISVVSVLVPIFVIVLGSADGLHMTSHVMDNLGEGASNRDAVAATLRLVGTPVIMTTLTTMAGFLSLLLINSVAIRQLGVTAAIGVLVAGIATWVILPTVLLHQKPLSRSHHPSNGRIFGIVLRLRGWPSVVISAALLAVFIPGALQLRANFSMIDMYKPSTDVRKSIDKAQEILGGSIPVYLTFNAENQLDPDLAAAVLEVQDRFAEAGVSSTSLSAYSVISAMWHEMSGKDGFPTNAAITRTLVTRMTLSNRDFMKSFFSDEGTGRAVFFLRDLDNDTLNRFISIADEVGEEHDVTFQPVGAAFVMKEMNDQIIPQQVGSLLLAAGLVFVLTAFMQRNFWLGLASTVPILITLVTLFGVMGYAGINLSIVTGIMSGLTVGVGIDYAIHFVSMLRQARSEGSDDPGETALRYVATPVIANALGLAIGFTAMFFSPLQIHVTLAILMWTTMVTSAFLSLTLLPTITHRRKRAGA